MLQVHEMRGALLLAHLAWITTSNLMALSMIKNFLFCREFLIANRALVRVVGAAVTPHMNVQRVFLVENLSAIITDENWSSIAAS